jgi:ATP-dependent Clp protease ATP-binding subunit ClpA
MKLRNPVRDMRTIKELLTGAEAEARRAGEAQPGAEHVLLSALALPDGSARRAFERVGADPNDVREAIAGQYADALRSIGVEPVDDETLDPPVAESGRVGGGVFRSSATAQSVFQEASKMARAEKGSQFAGAHVVAAVAQMEHGTAARALRRMGIDREELEAAARQEVATIRA